VWAQEVAAQEYEQTIVKYWDQMLQPEDDKYAVLARIPFQAIAFDAPGATTELEWGIKRTTFEGQGKTLDREGWREFLSDMKRHGYVIKTIEFHQNEFHIDADETAVSIFSVTLNVANEDATHRWTVQTKLRIEWTDEQDEDGHYIPGDLTLFDTTILERAGSPVFERQVLRPTIHPLNHPLVHDLNQDGFSDILLPRSNIVLRNRGDGQFDEEALFIAPNTAPPDPISTAIVVDLDRDGRMDLLCVGQYGTGHRAVSSLPEMGVFLFHGDASGRFSTPGERVASLPYNPGNQACMTAGDIDGDGDLDLWFAQYKAPYARGQMPTPFYDANDGYPAYLLLNRGDGTFDDATEAAGLAPKRYRRTYAASFVDLDEDHDLDLLVTSDFAGTDIYLNDGAGHFTDETQSLLEESANFGMGHTFADYDQNGALDFFVIGMGSTTMRRLNQMGLVRDDRPEYLEMRTRMGYGNRMYLSQGKRAFRQPEFKDSVARSGWSWGTTSFDFDSDGDKDIYVANGHLSGKTTRDYCTQYWCHDIYTGDSQTNPAIASLFKTPDIQGGTRLVNLSWDGYQKNHLFMNQSGAGFVNVAFLMNAAVIDDSRSVISDDFNADGRPDVLITSKRIDMTHGLSRQSLTLLINRWPIQNNWIGVRLQTAPGGPSTIGAVIRVRADSGEQLAHIVTGDSFRAQHAPMKHFGLGSDTRVHAIEIRWPDGAVEVIEDPAINTYHIVRPSTA
jgi:hypothetical protein